MVAQETKLRWTFDFKRQEPSRFYALLTTVVLITAMVYFTSDEAGVWWMLVSVFLLTFWLLPFFLPVTYELSDEGAAVYYSSLRIAFKPWSHYTRCVYDEYGMQLKTMVNDSWLDKFRGCFMRFPKGLDVMKSAIEIVGRHLPVSKNSAYDRKPRRGEGNRK